MSDDYKQRSWAHDIASYERLKAIRAGISNPEGKPAEFCDRRLAEIEAKYPQYLKRDACQTGAELSSHDRAGQ